MKNKQSLLGVTSQSFVKSNTQVAEPPTKDRHPKKRRKRGNCTYIGWQRVGMSDTSVTTFYEIEFKSNFNLQVSLV